MTSRDSGSILDGKYEIVERLATGGMGEVYRARHVHLQEHRVIKILRADKATDTHALQRFTQEARIATQIKHANVAILYDFARLDDGSFYMVWEHIAGEDVGSALRSRGPFEIKLAVELAIQALRGLDAIHSAGVIHRDISPDNLMLARDRRGKALVKIIDLGLAKNLEIPAGFEITQAGVFMGKLMYCSPEQAGSLADGVALDHRSDLYSFAAVLYEMVTGKPPFDSESDHGFVLRRLSEPPLSMIGRTAGITVPAALDEVVMRGLERDREARWPDALSFLRALVRVSEQLRQVSTQEIPAQPAAGARAPATISARSTNRPSSSELSREERLELLEQIDRAAKRVNEATRLNERARQAISERRFEAALETIAQLEALSPRYAGLVELRATLAATRRGEAVPGASAPTAVPPPAPAPPSPAEAEHKARVAEAERLLETYIRDHKQGLARFALEALVELAPDHPRRGDFESWVNLMGAEIAQLKDAETAVEQGRAALLRDDLAEARRQLERIERLDPSHRLPDQFRLEMEEAEQRQRSASEQARRRERLEQLIEERRLADAERELERLAAGGLARVSVEDYRLRISDIAALADREAQGREIERRYRERVQAKDWAGARDAVLDLERALPSSPRPAQLFSEVARFEEVDRKQQSIEQGVRQLEGFLAERKAAEAEMTLKILGQMAPDHPRLAQLAERVRGLRGA
ncbi:MAG TPA: protein kinase [Thermoanaerobaculia bacterium]